MAKDVQHGKPDDKASTRLDTDLDIARELQGLPGCVIKDSILRCKHLLAGWGKVKVMAALKHVFAVGVHMPVPKVRGCMHVHVAVGDEAHVGVAGPDGGEECNVVLHIPRLATVLRARETVGFQQGWTFILFANLQRTWCITCVSHTTVSEVPAHA